MADSVVLLPCPFCGGEARIDEESKMGGCFVECLGCRASSKMMFPLKCGVDDLLAEAWNERTLLAGDAVRERIARALWSAERDKPENYKWSREWPGLAPGLWTYIYREQADAVLAALGGGD